MLAALGGTYLRDLTFEPAQPVHAIGNARSCLVPSAGFLYELLFHKTTGRALLWQVYAGSSMDRISQRGTLKAYVRPLGKNAIDESLNNDISNVPKPLRSER